MLTAEEKYGLLIRNLKALKSCTVAFSGGVDSTFLLRAAHEALGDRVIAVTAVSSFFPARETEEAAEFCRQEGVRQITFRVNELETEGIRGNPKNRCYLCKRDLFRRILRITEEQGMNAAAEGSNMDDNGDYRPGLIAISELGIESPLRGAELYKAEIRALSRKMGLPTWNKPSFACLASRFVYGEEITEEKLGMVERAEQLLLSLGFRQFRVRIHGSMARIEILPEEFPKLFAEEVRLRVCRELRSFGFTYVSADLLGYRTGSMNEILPASEKNGCGSSGS